MRPFEGEKGERGVGFEGHTEIGALVAGLELMIDMVDDPDNWAVKQAGIVSKFGKDLLAADPAVSADPSAVAALRDPNGASIVLDVVDEHHLQLANYALQVAAQKHDDMLIRSVAMTTYDEFARVLHAGPAPAQ